MTKLDNRLSWFRVHFKGVFGPYNDFIDVTAKNPNQARQKVAGHIIERGLEDCKITKVKQLKQKQE